MLVALALVVLALLIVACGTTEQEAEPTPVQEEAAEEAAVEDEVAAE